MEEAFDTFTVEASELLEEMEQALLRIEEGDETPDTLNAVFRAAHTIKGSAGLFGLDDVVSFTHDIEHILDDARDGKIAIDNSLSGILLKCCDHIGDMVGEIIASGSITEKQREHGAELTERLSPWLASEEKSEAQSAATEDDSAAVEGCWHISLRMGEDALRNGMDPLSIVHYLSQLGDVQYLGVVDEAIPEENYDPESLYLGFEIGLYTAASKNDIDDAFMFVREDSTIFIIPPNSSIDHFVELIRTSPNRNELLGEILLNCGAITRAELEHALQQQNTSQKPEEKQPLGRILIDQKSTDERVVDAALEKQKSSRSSAGRFIRVDSERLDNLINLIGELVISHQRIDIIAGELSHVLLDEAVSDIKGFTEQVRDAALNLRMVPVGETFQRFKRIVRDTAADLNKDIELVLEGEETELDRSMIEKLTDPLTHIVRNAIDHGIESTEARLERNKNPRGMLKLSAFHDSGSVVIQITDDGGGLDRERIWRKAIENGIVEASQTLSDSEIQQLIFHPGFSTAEKVTSLSGRGVGMDVVKKNIEELQGAVSIDSEFGKGTRFTIQLPLTLAIIDGFHILASGTDFIIPHAAIVECINFNATRRSAEHAAIDLRGELVPYISLRELFSLDTPVDPLKAQEKELIVVKFGSQQAGILVDELYGEVQTVVKPLNPIFSSLKGLGGSSLLGSGKIAFILDVPQLIDFAVAKERRHTGFKEMHAGS